MRNFLAIVGINSIRFIHKASDKVHDLGAKTITFVSTMAFYIPLTLFREYGPKRVTRFLFNENDRTHAPPLDQEFISDSLEIRDERSISSLDSLNHPFTLARNPNPDDRKRKKARIFITSFLSNVMSSSISCGIIYIIECNSFSFLSPFWSLCYCVSFISLIKDLSKNALILFELDDSRFLNHLWQKDFRSLKKSMLNREYTPLQLERLNNVVDFYIKSDLQDPTVPYSREEFLHIKNLHSFSIASRIRLRNDGKFRNELMQSTPLPKDIVNLIISYASDFGITQDQEIIKFRDKELGLRKLLRN